VGVSPVTSVGVSSATSAAATASAIDAVKAALLQVHVCIGYVGMIVRLSLILESFPGGGGGCKTSKCAPPNEALIVCDSDRYDAMLDNCA
jgi:hypothetical protein